MPCLLMLKLFCGGLLKGLFAHSMDCGRRIRALEEQPASLDRWHAFRQKIAAETHEKEPMV